MTVAACAPSPEAPTDLTLTRASFADLPGWHEDPLVPALSAFVRSCAASGGSLSIAGQVHNIKEACEDAHRLPRGDTDAARAFFESSFRPYRVTVGDAASGLFTGYYEAEVRAARRPSDRYSVPVLMPPPDLVSVDLGVFDPELRGRRLVGRVKGKRLVPVPSRAEIEIGAYSGRGLEILWADDPVDVFFLHVQGSGRALMDTGEVVRIGYAASNGHPYVAIGRVLAKRKGVPPKSVTAPLIRQWLASDPQAAREIMAANPRYIFFRPTEGAGPFGAQGVALTPGRSLAIDPAYIPFGLPIWLDTVDPLDPRRPLRRLVVSQDAGAAIKGPVRGDLFWGHGADAEARAGTMRSQGQYFMLLPRGR